MSDMFPLKNSSKQGDALKPLLFNFALDCANRRVQVNQDGLYETVPKVLGYADEVSIHIAVQIFRTEFFKNRIHMRKTHFLNSK
jgi:hypothetical protein